jgi:hypothetical protein
MPLDICILLHGLDVIELRFSMLPYISYSEAGEFLSLLLFCTKEHLETCSIALNFLPTFFVMMLLRTKVSLSDQSVGILVSCVRVYK